MISHVGAWIPTFDALGIPPTTNINGGKTLGAMVGPSWINPSNLTRSYAKSAYLDPVIDRSNLHVLVNATATQITWADQKDGDDVKATGVRYVRTGDGKGGAERSVSFNKELILSGGVVGSPQLLMVSGVGPRRELEGAGVQVKVELDGVGAHVQDHLVSPLLYPLCLFT
jgi:choline dehydrogenase